MDLLSREQNSGPQEASTVHWIELVDSVFTPRCDPIYWDLSDFVELNSTSLRQDQSHDRGEQEEDNNATQIETDPLEKVVRHDFDYAMNSCVAVKPQSIDDGSPFWIWKIVKKNINRKGVINGLKLHCIQLDISSNIYDGRYMPQYLQQMRKSKRQSWQSFVFVDTFLVNYPYKPKTSCPCIREKVPQHWRTQLDCTHSKHRE